MRAVVQRVSEASVTVDGQAVGSIGEGMLVLVCAMQGDTDEDARKLAQKLASLRIFSDENGKMNRSALDIGGTALVVSQFTLAADTSRGNRPGFSRSAPPDEGERLCREFSGCLSGAGVPVETGRFGADMRVRLENDGPVTIWIDTRS